MDPKNRVTIITGASAGIGAATARLFAEAEARLVLAARQREPLEALAAELPGALVVPTDVADPEACRQLVARAKQSFGRVDLLINNAGVGLAGPAAELRTEDVQQALAVDLFGPLWLMQAVVPLMRAQGLGQIINVSSVLAAQPLPYLGAYAGAKAALERVSEALRMELRGTGVEVSVVRPGTTRTNFSAHRLGIGRERRSRFAPAGVTPETVARTILYVARHEPRCAYVTRGDRLGVFLATLFPGLLERLLARAIRWEQP
ncbi:SDR family NAD(P)-dependent oxidoreductase [Candidatus Viridilinea mediisalina]|uniref:Short-chain dehydrogenase n=1 Tax=Candidatus Viridilinea mediisalina TaxID=2024553 RepID=A0A2A6RL36_9CHLR|nr:SDR family NAD(P)-dependent oxidoreductase [Candidatus Viridilinea mediisalina]PDW03621.1 short-chain dehydrogenase [Candidatus Viridilinea mediisalina]